jgi:hypothetical protein
MLESLVGGLDDTRFVELDLLYSSERSVIVRIC